MKIDPRTKIIIVFLISSAAVMITELSSLLFLLLLTLILCRLFSVALSGPIKKLRKLLYFLVVLALIQSIFTPGGEVLVTAGGMRILTTAGLETGISIIIRMSVIVFSALIIASAPAMDVVYGLIAMKLPYEITFMVLLSIKFLPLFREEFADSLTAVQLAGADLVKIPLKQKLSLYSYVLTPSVIKALNRARFISLSMESRGFRAYPDRTSYCKLSMRGMDYVAIIAASAAVLLVVSYNFNIIG